MLEIANGMGMALAHLKMYHGNWLSGTALGLVIESCTALPSLLMLCCDEKDYLLPNFLPFPLALEFLFLILSLRKFA